MDIVTTQAGFHRFCAPPHLSAGVPSTLCPPTRGMLPGGGDAPRLRGARREAGTAAKVTAHRREGFGRFVSWRSACCRSVILSHLLHSENVTPLHLGSGDAD